MHKTGTLIECVERKLLDERQAVNLDVVALGSKLDLLYFLATDDWTYVWLVDAYDTLGMLSFALPLLWWLSCWRYIFVIVSISESCLSEKSPAQ